MKTPVSCIIKPASFQLFFLLLTLLLASVASAKEKQSINTSGPISQELISVTYITIRNSTGEASAPNYYGGGRGPLRTGVATVSFSPIKGLKEIAESAPFYIPDEIIELAEIRENSLQELLENTRLFTSQSDGNIVVYTHGYNIDFEKGCGRTAIFQKALGFHDRLLYFSWPSDGNMLKYTWDEADLGWSVPHMASFFKDLISSAGKGRVDIVAHSLGARGVVNALVRLAYADNSEPLINNLILIAPDIDSDIFRQEYPLLKDIVNKITVYVSKNDKPLRLSREVHGYPRLGEGGRYLSLIEGVETIDISVINNRRLSGHLYHLFSPEVIEDLGSLLIDEKPAGERVQLIPKEINSEIYYQLQPSRQ